jgi:hypothetical protein
MLSRIGLSKRMLYVQSPTAALRAGDALPRGWVSMTTVMSDSVDDGAYDVSIPFSFTFLGTSYSRVWTW